MEPHRLVRGASRQICATQPLREPKVILDKAAAAALARSKALSLQAAKLAQQAADLSAQASAEEQAKINAQLTSVTAQQVLDAQKMFDQYAKQLSEVETAAAQDAPPSVTYNQTINSPEALSPSEVYRNSKNLLSMTEQKLVGSTP